ncbi:MAG: RnfABCDGE type electron transport complex subunit D [Holophagae bacterium]|nr:RnfABCDGE type electron transport complex subunit D [Holophagae bacterium]
MESLTLLIQSSPHIRSEENLKRVMYDVVIALLPACAVSVWFFGWLAISVLVVTTVSAVLFEVLFLKVAGKENVWETALDGSALITGMLVAMNIPVTVPWWMCVLGGFVAIIIAKQVFGGLGYNIFNPALVARVFLLSSFPVQMTNWIKPVYFTGDAVTAATPLGLLKTEGLAAMQHAVSHTDLLVGRVGGSMGEMSALALLLGALFLLSRKVITWEIPVSVLGSLALFTGIFWLTDSAKYADPLFHVLAGGAVLGACFMATDMVTSPLSRKGMLIFGTGIGLLTGVIRLFGGYPEGISFAILIMNGFVPLIDRVTVPKKFGVEASS